MTFGTFIIGDEILSGKRQDKHLARVIAALKERGLELAWAHYLGDDRERISEALRRTLAGEEIVFCFGGIGATPDDHTRQSAAAAAGVPLQLHADAKREIEAQFGEQAYPRRIEMGVFPAGSRIIPNGFNRVPGFSLGRHHFFPGFPEMAWPMLEWVLDQEYQQLRREVHPVDRAIIVTGAGESQLVELMNECVSRFPAVKLFSLPSIMPQGGRRLELGVRGDPGQADAAMLFLKSGVSAAGFAWTDRE